MAKFSVRYFYLASGMEGMPDEMPMGIVEADTASAACDLVAAREPDTRYGPNNAYSTRDFFRSCLSATPVEALK